MRNSEQDASLRLAVGQRLAFDRVPFAASDVRARGALESVRLRRGLFAEGFGPGYYGGFVDQRPELVAVEPRESDPAPSASAAPSRCGAGAPAGRRWAWPARSP